MNKTKWNVVIEEWDEQSDPKFNGMFYIILTNLEDTFDFKVNDEINEIVDFLSILKSKDHLQDKEDIFFKDKKVALKVKNEIEKLLKSV